MQVTLIVKVPALICYYKFFVHFLVSFMQLLPKLSRDFVKKGYLHKTPPNRNVSVCFAYHAMIAGIHRLYSISPEISEEIFRVGFEETNVLREANSK